MLLSSHALTEMEARTDRVAILEHGRLIACGNAADLRRQARLPVQVRITVPLCRTGRVAERLGHGLSAGAAGRADSGGGVPARAQDGAAADGSAELGPQIEDVDIVPAGTGRAVPSLPGPEDAVVTPVAVIALQEIENGLRNRWVLAATLLLACLALSLTLLGSAPTGAVKVSALTVTVVSLASLTIFLVPLIALLLAYEAIVGEAERGTLLLLLAYPVARQQVLARQVPGSSVHPRVATVVGYGGAPRRSRSVCAGAPIRGLGGLRSAARLVDAPGRGVPGYRLPPQHPGARARDRRWAGAGRLAAAGHRLRLPPCSACS